MANLSMFEENLSSSLNNPSLTASELAEIIVVSALEAEFGKSFTMNAGFAKMKKTLAEAIVTNPDLRRQALKIANDYMNNQNDDQKNI